MLRPVENLGRVLQVVSFAFQNTAVTILGGLLLFGERSNWQKILAVIGILAGIVITVMG